MRIFGWVIRETFLNQNPRMLRLAFRLCYWTPVGYSMGHPANEDWAWEAPSANGARAGDLKGPWRRRSRSYSVVCGQSGRWQYHGLQVS